MLKRQELLDPNSCLNKAKSEELVFVLRENDPLFSQAVRHWATMADGIHEPAKIAAALKDADDAERKRLAREAPDLLPEVASSQVAPGFYIGPAFDPFARPVSTAPAFGNPAARHTE